MPTPRQYASPAERQAAYRHRLAEVRKQELATRGMPSLPAVTTIPGHRRWQALIGGVLRLLEVVQTEMQEYYDQRSDPWQESEKGEAFTERLQAVQEAQDALADLCR